MENVHPASIIKCSATRLEECLSVYLKYGTSRGQRLIIKRACSRLYGHETRSKKYPVPTYLHTCIGQFGFRKNETLKFKKICYECYIGRYMNSGDLQYACWTIQKYYIKQLLTYSDIVKLKRIWERYDG